MHLFAPILELQAATKKEEEKLWRHGRFVPSAAHDGRGLVHLAFNALPIAEDGATLHVLNLKSLSQKQGGIFDNNTGIHGISQNSQPKTIRKDASKYWGKFTKGLREVSSKRNRKPSVLTNPL